MIILVQQYSKNGPIKPSRAPAIILVKDRWNDFGYRTLFTLYYCPTTMKMQEIGTVKILELGESSTDISPESARLERNYCSLGQTEEYYKSIDELGAVGKQILDVLNDVTASQSIHDLFVEEDGFNVSLLREGEAIRVYEARRQTNLRRNATFYFRFRARLPGCDQVHEVDFDFSSTPIVPGNVFAIIGKNGSGKTQYLKRLADAISGTHDIDREWDEFSPARPAFSTVIAISYSAFDDFSKESTRTAKGYAYCGIYDKNGKLRSRLSVWKGVRADFQTILSLGREMDLRKCVNILFDPMRAEIMCLQLDTWDNRLAVPQKSVLSKISAGELFVLASFCRILSFIKDTSLVIFDEPELHLHPNAVSRLVNALRFVLGKFKSFAVLATHSPIVLQQIPSRSVRVMRRTPGGPVVTGIELECFGQDLSSITEAVFHSADEPAFFATWFDEVSEEYSEEDIQSAFGRELSFNAKSYLASIRRGS